MGINLFWRVEVLTLQSVFIIFQNRAVTSFYSGNEFSELGIEVHFLPKSSHSARVSAPLRCLWPENFRPILLASGTCSAEIECRFPGAWCPRLAFINFIFATAGAGDLAMYRITHCRCLSKNPATTTLAISHS